MQPLPFSEAELLNLFVSCAHPFSVLLSSEQRIPYQQHAVEMFVRSNECMHLSIQLRSVEREYNIYFVFARLCFLLFWFILMTRRRRALRVCSLVDERDTLFQWFNPMQCDAMRCEPIQWSKLMEEKRIKYIGDHALYEKLARSSFLHVPYIFSWFFFSLFRLLTCSWSAAILSFHLFVCLFVVLLFVARIVLHIKLFFHSLLLLLLFYYHSFWFPFV